MTHDQKMGIGEKIFRVYCDLARQVEGMPESAVEMATYFIEQRLEERCNDPDCHACMARPYLHPISMHLVQVVTQFAIGLAQNKKDLTEANGRFENENPRFRNRTTEGHHDGNPFADLLGELIGGRTPNDIRRARREEGHFVTPEELLSILIGGLKI